MEQQAAQDIITTYGPSAAVTIAVLAALGRPGSVEGIVRWVGDSIHAVGGWTGRLAEKIADSFIRRIDSTTRVNETLAIALQLEQPETEPRRAGAVRRSAEVRSLTQARPGVGPLEETIETGPGDDHDTSG